MSSTYTSETTLETLPSLSTLPSFAPKVSLSFIPSSWRALRPNKLSTPQHFSPHHFPPTVQRLLRSALIRNEWFNEWNDLNRAALGKSIIQNLVAILAPEFEDVPDLFGSIKDWVYNETGEWEAKGWLVRERDRVILAGRWDSGMEKVVAGEEEPTDEADAVDAVQEVVSQAAEDTRAEEEYEEDDEDDEDGESQNDEGSYQPEEVSAAELLLRLKADMGRLAKCGHLCLVAIECRTQLAGEEDDGPRSVKRARCS